MPSVPAQPLLTARHSASPTAPQQCGGGTWLSAWGHHIRETSSWSVSACSSSASASASSSSVGVTYVAWLASCSGRVMVCATTAEEMSAAHVFTLPVNVTPTCVALHPEKLVMSVGSEGHGALVVPLVSADKGGRWHGDSVDAPSGSEDLDTSAIFTAVDSAFISAATGRCVTSVAFSPRPKIPSTSPSSAHAAGWILVVGSRKAEHALVSVWGLDGDDHRSLLWCSSPLSASGVLQFKSWADGNVCFRTRDSIGVVFFRDSATAPSSATTTTTATVQSRQHGPRSTTVEPMHGVTRSMALIPELADCEFVSMVALPGSGEDSASSSCDEVLALTKSGFLVSFHPTNGTVSKWMDVKVCPASSMTLAMSSAVPEEPLLVIGGGGGLVRWFQSRSWTFVGKQTLATGNNNPTTVLVSPVTESVLSASSSVTWEASECVVAVMGGVHRASPLPVCLLSSSGSMQWFVMDLYPPSSQSDEKRARYRLKASAASCIPSPRCLTVEGWTAAKPPSLLLPSAASPHARVGVLFSPSTGEVTLLDRSSMRPYATCVLERIVRIALLTPHPVTGRMLLVTVDHSKDLTVWSVPPFAAGGDAGDEKLLTLLQRIRLQDAPIADMCWDVQAGDVQGDMAETVYRLFLLTAGGEENNGSRESAQHLSLLRFSLVDRRQHVRDGAGVQLGLEVSRSITLPMLQPARGSLQLLRVGKSLLLVDGYQIWDVAALAHWNPLPSAETPPPPCISLPSREVPVSSTLVTESDRLILTTAGSTDVFVVDPVWRGAGGEWGRVFHLQAPFPLCGCPSGTTVDSGVMALAVLSANRDEIAVLSMRERLQTRQRVVAKGAAFAAIAFLNTATDDEHSLGLGVAEVAPQHILGAGGTVGIMRVSTTNSNKNTTGAMSPGSNVTKAPSQSPQLPPKGRQPLAAVHRDPTIHNQRRATSYRSRSCEVPQRQPVATAECSQMAVQPPKPAVTLKGLQDRLEELQQLAAGTRSTGSGRRKSSSPPATEGVESTTQRPSSSDVVFHADPCRSSGLLMTPQIAVHRSGEVVVRLGQRWGASHWAAAGARLELPRVGGRGEDSTLMVSVMSGDDERERTAISPRPAVEESLASPSPVGASRAVDALGLQPGGGDDEDDLVLVSGLSTLRERDSPSPAAAPASALTPPVVCDSPVKAANIGEGAPDDKKWSPRQWTAGDDEEDDYVVMDSMELEHRAGSVVPRVQFGVGVAESLAEPVVTMRPSEASAHECVKKLSRVEKLRVAAQQVRQSLVDLRSLLLESMDETSSSSTVAEEVEHSDESVEQVVAKELNSVLNDLALTIHESASRPASRAQKTTQAPVRVGDDAAAPALNQLLLTHVAAAHNSLQLQALWDSMQQLRQQNNDILKALAANSSIPAHPI